MKKTQLIELIKNIRKSSVSFISIVVFVALGTCCFLGINWSTTNFTRMVDKTVNDGEMYNADLIYPYGFSEEFVTEIRNLDDVSFAEGYYSTEEHFRHDGIIYQTRVLSLCDNVNTPTIQEGTLPDKKGEIAVQKFFADKHNISIGDEIVFEHDDKGNAHALYYLLNEDLENLNNDKPTEDGIKSLLTDYYKVTALIETPQYINQYKTTYGVSQTTSIPNDCIMYVDKASFDEKAFLGYTNIAVRNKDLDAFYSSTDEYDEASNKFIEKLQPLVDEYTEKKNAQVLKAVKDDENKIIEEIGDSENKLLEAEEELNDALEQLRSKRTQLINAKELLDKSQREIDAGWAEVNQKQALINKNEADLEKIEKIYKTVSEILDALIYIDDNQDVIKEAIVDIHDFLKLYGEIIKITLPDDYYTLQLLDQLYEKVNSGYYDDKIDEFEKDYLLIIDEIYNSETYASIEKVIGDLNEMADNKIGIKQLSDALKFINKGYDDNFNYPKIITDSYNIIRSVDKTTLLSKNLVSKLITETSTNTGCDLSSVLGELLNNETSSISSINDILTNIQKLLNDNESSIDSIYNSLKNSSIPSEIRQQKAFAEEQTDETYKNYLLDDCEKGQAFYNLAYYILDTYKICEDPETLESTLSTIVTFYDAYGDYIKEKVPGVDSLFDLFKDFLNELSSDTYDGKPVDLAVRYLKLLSDINNSTFAGVYQMAIYALDYSYEYDVDIIEDPYRTLANMMSNLLDEFDSIINTPVDVIEIYRIVKEDGSIVYLETLFSKVVEEKFKEYNIPTLKEIFEYIDEQFDIGYEKFKDVANTISEMYTEYVSEAKQVLLDNRHLIDDAWKELADAKQKLKEAINKLTEAQKQVDEGLKEYEEALALLNSMQFDPTNAYRELEEGKSKIAEANDKLAQYQDMTKEIEAYDNAILGRNANPALASSKVPIQIMNNIKFSLAVIFVIVGVFVCYSVISRIVFEDTKLIGTKKALGLRKNEITLLYLAYAFLAALLGSIAGNLLAAFVIEPIISTALVKNYIVTNTQIYFNAKDALLFFLFETILSVLFAYIACQSVIKEKTTYLLNGNNTKTYKEHFYEKFKIWDKLSLFDKTVINNFFNDKRRVFATIVGVVGCCSLMVSSLTLNYNLDKSRDYQLNNVTKFDTAIYLDTGIDNALENIEEKLEQENIAYSPAYFTNVSYKKPNGSYINGTIYAYEDESFRNFFKVANQGNEVSEISDGIWVSEVFADTNNVSVGDSIGIVDGKGNEHSVKVAGTFNYYLVRVQGIMNSKTFEETFNTEYYDNLVIFNRGQKTINELFNEFDGMEGFSSVFDTKDETNTIFNSVSSVMIIVVIVYFLLAFVLAFLVLLNLYFMFVDEKKKELIIMMINGYYTKDVKKYIYKDTVLLTVIGIVLGCVLGIVVGFATLKGLDSDSLRVLRTFSLGVCVICGLLTAVLSLVNCLVALRKVDKFKLRDLGK